MFRFNFLLFIVLVKGCFASVQFSEVFETAVYNVRSKRDGNADASPCESRIHGGADSEIKNKDAEGKGCFYRSMTSGDKIVEIKIKMFNYGPASFEEESFVVLEGPDKQKEPFGAICSKSDVETIQRYHKNSVFIEYKHPLKQEGELFMIGYSFVEDNFTNAQVPNTTVGGQNDATLIGGSFCDESLQGHTLLSSRNSLDIEFKTDMSFTLGGFKATISFVLNRVCECEDKKICIRQDNEKKCITGKHCKVNICQNGGTCVQTGFTRTCYCPSGFQGDDCSTQIQSFHQLTFIIAPKDRSIKRDTGHTEECQVEVPQGETVQYDWTFNGILIYAYQKRIGYGSFPGGVLQIDKFTESFVGQYSCFASTSFAFANHTFEYRIVENCDVKIYPGPQSESKKIEENAVLMCHVDSRAKEVRWKKDGVYIDFDKNERYRQLVNNYLHIRNIEMSDAGTYRCEAEDNYGCYSYKDGTLTVVNVKPLNKYCGISIYDEVVLASSRIAKGHEANSNEIPWHVTFRSRGNSSRHLAFCGGTLISRTYILTAAHCIEEYEDAMKAPWTPENVLFLLGTTSCLENENGITRTFKSFTVHPEYGARSTNDNDIAVIELDSPVQYTDAIRPICLEPSEYIDRVFLENSRSLSPIPGRAAGCGAKRKHHRGTDVLQVVPMPYVVRTKCEESVRWNSKIFTDTMFCAGSNISRMGDTCAGDGGGGLIMTASKRWVQTGIVSWGMGCDVSRFYGYYTDVGKFYHWIGGITHFSEEEVPDFF